MSDDIQPGDTCARCGGIVRTVLIDEPATERPRAPYRNLVCECDTIDGPSR